MSHCRMHLYCVVFFVRPRFVLSRTRSFHIEELPYARRRASCRHEKRPDENDPALLGKLFASNFFECEMANFCFPVLSKRPCKKYISNIQQLSFREHTSVVGALSFVISQDSMIFKEGMLWSHKHPQTFRAIARASTKINHPHRLTFSDPTRPNSLLRTSSTSSRPAWA